MGRWIRDWDPEDGRFWRERGRSVARRNLVFSIFAEFLGFSVWQLWSVVAVKLGDHGFDYSTGQLFWLVSLPGLVGATMRFPYTFAVPRFGGRNWTVVSALLLLIPTIGLAVMVSDPATPYWLMLATAATAGFGGGNFASSMANISFFYPDARKGLALGLNAAGGNIGVAVVQKVVPVAIGVALLGGGLATAGLIWVPFILLAALCAWRFMDNLVIARSPLREQLAVVRRPHTWSMTWLYIGTFGSFIGFGAALPLLIKTQFPDVDPLQYAFLGPLVGSLARPLGGGLSDRWGGARVTAATFVAMGAGVLAVIASLDARAFGPFLAAFMFLFVASGVGNGSTFRMIPVIFREQANGDAAAGRRDAAAVMGFVSAVAAYGSFLIPQGYNLSIEATGGIQAALVGFLGFYGTCVALTWWCYVRGSGAAARLAEARA
jgi:NNP family nitrate/nitrite transporter-like MFS transporter